MNTKYTQWDKTQRLVMDIVNIQRHHYVPGTDRHENVAEHSFSVALLCWAVFNTVRPPLDLAKIFKYALAHDFLERGLNKDVSSFADQNSKELKKQQEAKEFKKIKEEFHDFEELSQILQDYEEKVDEESVFVWSVDKLQPILLGHIDDWRPYKSDNISYQDFCKRYDKVCEECSPHVKDIFKDIFEYGRETYYDQPE